MLVRLFGRNFRSLRDNFELSMVAADLKRRDDSSRGTIEVAIDGMPEPLRLLRSIAIFGPNASGKSTVLTASQALRWLATDSSSRSKPDARIPPYEPFLLDAALAKSPIELGCDVVLKSKILRYELSFNKKSILTERLALIGGNEETVLIDRIPDAEVKGSLFVRGGANELYVKEMQPNVTVLSKLAQHGPHKGPESARPYYKAIRNATLHEDYSDAAGMQIKLGDDRFGDDPDYQSWIMEHLMREADVGICGVTTRRESFEFPDGMREQLEKLQAEFKLPDTRLVVSFTHQGENNTRHSLDFSLESSGTRKLFNLAGDWWRLANEAVTCFADELSASLHPRLLDRLIRSVNDAPKRVESQLIFTTHDTGLLESQDGLPPALRRDQVYFTAKNDKGATELYSLAEFKEDARPVHNIRKRYLSGLYGALPSVKKLSL